ncbi:MAG: hypothetical protein ACR2M1_14410 [Gemmatimonadaceae bacterium]
MRRHKLSPHLEMPGLTAEHFARWVATLEAIVDARFAGPTAHQMKELAHRIAYSMQLRLGISPFAPYRLARSIGDNDRGSGAVFAEILPECT